VCLGLDTDLAEAANVRGKVQQLREGAHVNPTEDRAAMHIALRAGADEVSGNNRTRGFSATQRPVTAALT
jgi:glucose-6-phosphate isomerase